MSRGARALPRRRVQANFGVHLRVHWTRPTLNRGRSACAGDDRHDQREECDHDVDPGLGGHAGSCVLAEPTRSNVWHPKTARNRGHPVCSSSTAARRSSTSTWLYALAVNVGSECPSSRCAGTSGTPSRARRVAKKLARAAPAVRAPDALRAPGSRTACVSRSWPRPRVASLGVRRRSPQPQGCARAHRCRTHVTERAAPPPTRAVASAGAADSLRAIRTRRPWCAALGSRRGRRFAVRFEAPSAVRETNEWPLESIAWRWSWTRLREASGLGPKRLTAHRAEDACVAEWPKHLDEISRPARLIGQAATRKAKSRRRTSRSAGSLAAWHGHRPRCVE